MVSGLHPPSGTGVRKEGREVRGEHVALVESAKNLVRMGCDGAIAAVADESLRKVLRHVAEVGPGSDFSIFFSSRFQGSVGAPAYLRSPFSLLIRERKRRPTCAVSSSG